MHQSASVRGSRSIRAMDSLGHRHLPSILSGGLKIPLEKLQKLFQNAGQQICWPLFWLKSKSRGSPVPRLSSLASSATPSGHVSVSKLNHQVLIGRAWNRHVPTAMDPERTDRRLKDLHDAIYLTCSNYLTDVSKTISLDDDIGKMLMWYQFQDTYVVSTPVQLDWLVGVLICWNRHKGNQSV